MTAVILKDSWIRRLDNPHAIVASALLRHSPLGSLHLRDALSQHAPTARRPAAVAVSTTLTVEYLKRHKKIGARS